MAVLLHSIPFEGTIMKKATESHRPDSEDQAEIDAQRAKERGDILGLGDADPNKKLPGHVRPDGSNPAGIEVGQRATGIGDLRRGSGATGIDMGAGGTGTHVGTDDSRQRRRENNEDAD
jgi:hypothetical protein